MQRARQQSNEATMTHFASRLDYDEGYSKGHYEFTQAAKPAVGGSSSSAGAAKSGAAPISSTPTAKPANSSCSASESAGSVTLCNRDFAFAGSLIPARHCFVWGHPAGTNMTPNKIDPSQTSTYDPSTSGTPDPATDKEGTECLQTYNVDPACVQKKYGELCDPKTFNMGEQNCCSCAQAALTACGAKTGPADFPKDNQGVGLPDSYGTGWKKSLLKGGNVVLDGMEGSMQNGGLMPM